MVTRLQAEWSESKGLIPDSSKDFTLPHHILTQGRALVSAVMNLRVP